MMLTSRKGKKRAKGTIDLELLTELTEPRTRGTPRWRYEAFKRWFLSSKEAQESRAIKAAAERQAGER